MGDNSQAAKDRISNYRRFNILSICGTGVEDEVYRDLLEHKKFFRNIDLIVGAGAYGMIQAVALAGGLSLGKAHDFGVENNLNSFAKIRDLKHYLEAELKGICLSEVGKKLALISNGQILHGEEPVLDVLTKALIMESDSVVDPCLTGAAHAVRQGSSFSQLRILSLGWGWNEKKNFTHFQADALLEGRYRRINGGENDIYDDRSYDFNAASKWLDKYWK